MISLWIQNSCFIFCTSRSRPSSIPRTTTTQDKLILQDVLKIKTFPHSRFVSVPVCFGGFVDCIVVSRCTRFVEFLLYYSWELLLLVKMLYAQPSAHEISCPSIFLYRLSGVFGLRPYPSSSSTAMNVRSTHMNG